MVVQSRARRRNDTVFLLNGSRVTVAFHVAPGSPLLKTVLGLVAGSLTAFAWLPQLFRIFRHQRADDIAWGYLVVISIGVSLWFIYGILTRAIPLIAANGISDCFVITVIAKKFQLRQLRQTTELTKDL